MNITLKLIGSGIMIFASFLWGRKKSNAEKHKLILLNDIIAFIKFLRDNISHFKTPIPRICKSYETSNSEIKAFLDEVSAYGLRIAWENNTELLPEKARGIMSHFTAELGQSYGNDSIELCDYTLSELHKISEALISDYTERRKMWYSLPPLFVSSIILIFI